jgi:hypothetical protein
MGRVGSSYENALAESFWQGLKRETMHQRLFSTMRQARLEIFQWLTYYNARRRHSALNYLSPAEFEQHQQRARTHTRSMTPVSTLRGTPHPLPRRRIHELLQGLHVPIRQPIGHRLDRLPTAVQHQTPQITLTPPPLIPPRQRPERIGNELRQLTTEPFHLPQPHTGKLPTTRRDHPT